MATIPSTPTILEKIFSRPTTFPEAPDLNPIENMWHELEEFIRREVKCKTKDVLWNPYAWKAAPARRKNVLTILSCKIKMALTRCLTAQSKYSHKILMPILYCPAPHVMYCLLATWSIVCLPRDCAIPFWGYCLLHWNSWGMHYVYTDIVKCYTGNRSNNVCFNDAISSGGKPKK